jgi:hypothetical protein
LFSGLTLNAQYILSQPSGSIPTSFGASSTSESWNCIAAAFRSSGGGGGTEVTVGSVVPSCGPIAGGTAVTIIGTNFVDDASIGSSVLFGGDEATDVIVVSSTEITCLAPAHSAGAVDVSVSDTYGTGTLANAFTYTLAPTVTGITPSQGPTAGGTAVTITGTNFSSGATVSFGGSSATDVVVVSSTEITCLTPAGVVGAVTVSVITPCGGVGSLADAFTYTASGGGGGGGGGGVPTTIALPWNREAMWHKTPHFNTVTQKPAAVRGVVTASDTPYPTWDFKASLIFIEGDESNAASILAYFLDIYMQAHGEGGFFLIPDQNDNTVAVGNSAMLNVTPGASTPMGVTGDGVSKQFQLARTIGPSGLAIDVIQNLNGTPTLYVNGSPTAAYTISTTAVVTFTTAPSEGATLKWSGGFYFLCQFADDTQADLARIGCIPDALNPANLDGLWSCGDIKFSSVFV